MSEHIYPIDLNLSSLSSNSDDNSSDNNTDEDEHNKFSSPNNLEE
jgi:hypothetical protein